MINLLDISPEAFEAIDGELGWQPTSSRFFPYHRDDGTSFCCPVGAAAMHEALAGRRYAWWNDRYSWPFSIGFDWAFNGREKLKGMGAAFNQGYLVGRYLVGRASSLDDVDSKP